MEFTRAQDEKDGNEERGAVQSPAESSHSRLV